MRAHLGGTLVASLWRWWKGKEAVATVETNEAPAVVASEDSKPQVTTGTVVVNIEFEE